MIHKFKMHDKNIVLDVNSGAVHVLDDLAFEMHAEHISSEDDDYADKTFFKNYSREEVLEALAELKELKENGQLFSEDL